MVHHFVHQLFIIIGPCKPTLGTVQITIHMPCLVCISKYLCHAFKYVGKTKKYICHANKFAITIADVHMSPPSPAYLIVQHGRLPVQGHSVGYWCWGNSPLDYLALLDWWTWDDAGGDVERKRGWNVDEKNSKEVSDRSTHGWDAWVESSVSWSTKCVIDRDRKISFKR